MCAASDPNLYETCTAPKDSVPFPPSMFRNTICGYHKDLAEDGRALQEMSMEIRNRCFELGLNLTIPRDSLFSNIDDVVISDERLKTIVRSLLQDASFNLAAQQYKQAVKRYHEGNGMHGAIEYEHTENEYLQVLARALVVYYPVEMQKIIDWLVDAHKKSDLGLYNIGSSENPYEKALLVNPAILVTRDDIYDNWPKEIRFMLPPELLDWVRGTGGMQEEEDKEEDKEDKDKALHWRW